ncbi:atypical/ABC1/ABC1-B protein kinase [Puccinia graminis f. sp. tritici CRL 75-36-700-3]|uniref:Atypical/ABC1/ABC1-B protein kinase n=1 Tax=Puccinia graminis f. sp. tritici (strain CRL 75-36-700-3 / race SCCL) TaxID=418459 RepID=E3L0M3_PUCGT|nr:atypical/ABC1/ABC1-B protein kinase [Puccinia graminis f. sp. tritici CRL 75-36-700-3]EFP90151.2 atypical/ABC1/ABC1-B protein kinase [Puccinia graminis f. sp. tritici CRL 75-36-700-3]
MAIDRLLSSASHILLTRPFATLPFRRPTHHPLIPEPVSLRSISTLRPPPGLVLLTPAQLIKPIGGFQNTLKHSTRSLFTASLLRQHAPRTTDRLHNPTTRLGWTISQKVVLGLTISLVIGTALYEFVPPFRYAAIGIVRSTRVVIAVVGAMWDYKTLFAKVWADDPAGQAQRHLDYQTTHLTAARRILNVLKQNGGIYVKLGQHLSSIQLIPPAWSSTMKPLQDQCTPSSFEMIDKLFLLDVGLPIRELFLSFDPVPIGVASLAQVHRAVDRISGRDVAVKVMHPTLEEYLEVDTRTVVIMLRFVKWVFPEFEFTWLGEEMQENLPKEMDFRIEAANASKCAQQFSDLKSTTLKLPDVLWAQKRVLVMEFITGGRFDDLEYLAQHNIDRNRASQELTRIFSQMIYLNGYFHADPHAGNLLIRPAPSTSRSPHNFEIVLLDHGLYFDLTDSLRVNYARFWLSLLSSSSSSVAARKKYAKLVGNIDEKNYDIFESAITGRVGLKGSGSLLNLSSKSSEELKLIQSAIVSQEGIFAEILKILRNVPRRLLMILKVNDLTRSLDLSLRTTHSQIRIWLIVARFCGLAIWIDECRRLKLELSRLRTHFRFRSSLQLFARFVHSWWEYQKCYNLLRVFEISMDFYAGLKKSLMYLNGLLNSDGDHPGGGFSNAKRKAAGL